MMADLHKDPSWPQHNCFLSQIVRPIVQSVRLYVTIQQEKYVSKETSLTEPVHLLTSAK